MKKSENLHKFGFIIICNNYNIKQIADTIKSIRIYYPDYPVIISCDSTFTKEQIKNIKILEIKNNVISKTSGEINLIDAGISDAIPNWNILLVSGSRLKTKIDKKYTLFTKSEKDILYPVINRKFYFHESSWTGMMFSKMAYKDLGGFPAVSNDLSRSKVIFEGEGLEKGYRFVGIVGLPIVV